MFRQNKKTSKAPASTGPSRPRLAKNSVLTILDKDFCVIGQGRVNDFDTSHVTLMRLPGILTMPAVNVDDKLYVQGENESGKTFTLEITVSEASRIYITGTKLNPIETKHQRAHTRYVINRQAEVILGQGKQSITQVCDLIDISMGGARIESNVEYPLDKTFRLRVELYDKSGPISFECQVVRVKKLNSARTEYGLLFAELNSQQRRYLSEDLAVVRENQNRRLK